MGEERGAMREKDDGNEEQVRVNSPFGGASEPLGPFLGYFAVTLLLLAAGELPSVLGRKRSVFQGTS